MNPRRRRQRNVLLTRVIDGVEVLEPVVCRGFQEGLPVFGWGEVPDFLFTARQLRAAGLRPGGQDPSALLVFRHFKPHRREEAVSLFDIERALPRRVATAAQLRAVRAALRARRTCKACGRTFGYYLPTSTGLCWTCDDPGPAESGSVLREIGELQRDKPAADAPVVVLARWYERKALLLTHVAQADGPDAAQARELAERAHLHAVELIEGVAA